jgi:bifunctional N-acetylglucosamine-1-phosphate-uridyltransferase/glucosamine-1-phosphate-acetyltransferase GlmU-like protein
MNGYGREIRSQEGRETVQQLIESHAINNKRKLVTECFSPLFHYKASVTEQGNKMG